MRILVIEDERGIREGLRDQLVREGFTVTLAADAKEGLFVATEFDLDVAIVDLGLPGMSGLDVIRKLREKGKGFPILILTARNR